MKSIARRIADGDMLRPIKLWLQSPVETTDGNGVKRMEGGKAVKRGVPQGGVVSPLLANLYMNRFLKHWRGSACDEAFRARVVNYADDFVILSRGRAAAALEWTDRVMTRLGLTLKRTKTDWGSEQPIPDALTGVPIRGRSCDHVANVGKHLTRRRTCCSNL